MTLPVSGTPRSEVETDDVLIDRVRSGDANAFAGLMRRYNQRVYRVARAIMRDDAEAEDVVQQAYLSAYLNIGSFAGLARFSTWLTRIVVHEALARKRARQRLTDVPADAQLEWETISMAPPPFTPEEQVSTLELASIFEKAIDELPEGYRVVLVMREVEGLSTAEVAGCLDISEEAVRVRLHRARAVLRDTVFAQVGRGAPEVFAFAGARCNGIVMRVLERIAALES
jgi:RNA polymerase sigma-70 factor (ECF subfamily)